MKKLLLVLLLVLTGTSVSLQAQSTYYVKQDATGTANGTSWANAYTTLQQAEDNAPDGADIWIAAGTYIANASDRNERILEISNSHNWYGGFNGTETQLSQRDPETNVTIISGDALGNGSADASAVADNAYNLVRVNASVDLLFDGLTFKEAHTNSGGGLNGNGGVIQFAGVENSIEMNTNAVFNNCIIQNNYSNNNTLYYIQENATYYGSVDVQFNACSIVNNRSYYLFQAIYDSWDNSNSSYDTKHIYFTSCLIAENTSSTRGIFLIDLALPCDVRLINNTIVNNTYASPHYLIENAWGIMSTFQNSVQLYNNIINKPSGLDLTNNATAIPNAANNMGNHSYFGANNETNSSLFEDYNNGDYHLATNSPAISAANSAYLLTNMSTDADNNPRELGSLDIGAYEYSSCDIDNIVVTPLNTTNLNVNWQGSPEVTAPYELTIVPTGQPISSGTTVTGVTNTSYLFSGLTQNTTYDIYINYNCPSYNIQNVEMITATTGVAFFVDANATGNNDGTTWADAFTTIDAAIAQIVASTTYSVIYVAKGTYTPHATDPSIPLTINLDNLTILGGFAGTESSLNDRDNSLIFTTNATVITGDLLGNDITGDFTNNRTDNSANLLNITANDVRIEGFIFSGAHADGTNNPIINTNNNSTTISDLTLRYCKITDNYSSGVFIDFRNFTNTIEMENIDIDSNLSENGLMLLQSSGNEEIQVSLTNFKFTNNTYSSDWGGIWFRRGNSSSITTTLTNGTLVDNLNSYNGSVPNLITQSSPIAEDNVLTILNTIFWNNQYTSNGNVLVSDTDISNPKSNEGNSQWLILNRDIINLVNPNFSPYSTILLSDSNPNLDAAYMPTTNSVDVLDMGVNSWNNLNLDLAGNPRISNGTIDLGAYEYATAPADINAPTLAVQDITVYLDANGQATITAQDIDNGTTDNTTATTDLTLALDITSFDCDDLGTNTVVFTATDEAGNSDSTNATVTVVDNLAPTVTTYDVTFDLAGNSSFTIPPQAVLDAAIDNCSVSSITIDQDTFTTIGTYTVTLTVTDSSNNQSTATAIVTIQDTMGLEDEELETLKVYPNPATTAVTVTGSVEIEKLQLFNLQGQLINTSFSNNIATNNIAPGIYLLKIHGNNKVVTKRIIKQ
ncbi:T9SS type A sorting domain-containing protein [Neptunitalea lumnitzerae]|uniref:Fibronectin type-III domain-containing protein n=1 Tax=Neptunitalea lumnitzerae TaxID=2965509 RepID=A0ABQ5MEI0_9FLAO|nr:T9SS type A sorting domain-containing protein [Neptunitalea sp. Y10]GLB47784.1 hypothetical protein Y10_01520 [Neptunitalea sp. Y10]